ncbi:hypothetical protein BSKO_09910 [Bryopsis sp. KO-2023]|nr:hypothetical protein BSKO_09910 [Bryopsis sp. KO-2023]
MSAAKLGAVRLVFILSSFAIHANAGPATEFLADADLESHGRGLTQEYATRKPPQRITAFGGVVLSEFVAQDRPSGILPKLIGGDETNPGDFDWIASLRFPDGVSVRGKDMSGQHFCGGSLIAKNVVLTAGHCLVHRLLKKPVVHIGRFLREGDDEGRFETFQTKETRVHPDFKGRSGVYDFDIALLVLDGDSNAEPRGIRKDEKCFGESAQCGLGTALGWGLTVSGDTESAADRLLMVRIPPVPRKQCGELIGTTITDAMVCAGEKGKDACQLDSGGPLIFGKFIAGLTSWGKGCGENPGVYTNVGGLSEWVDRQLKEISGEIVPEEEEEEEKPKPPPEESGPPCRFHFGRYLPPGCNKD